MGWHDMARHMASDGSQATCSAQALQSTACSIMVACHVMPCRCHAWQGGRNAQPAQQQFLMPSAAAATCFAKQHGMPGTHAAAESMLALALFLPAAGRRSAQLGAACLHSGMARWVT